MLGFDLLSPYHLAYDTQIVLLGYAHQLFQKGEQVVERGK